LVLKNISSNGKMKVNCMEVSLYYTRILFLFKFLNLFLYLLWNFLWRYKHLFFEWKLPNSIQHLDDLQLKIGVLIQKIEVCISTLHSSGRLYKIKWRGFENIIIKITKIRFWITALLKEKKWVNIFGELPCIY